MGLTFVQERHNTGSPVHVALSLASVATVGSYLIACVWWNTPNGVDASVSDVTNGAWTLIGGNNNAGTFGLQIFQMPSNAASDHMAITATIPSSAFGAMKVLEFTGQALSSPLDGITALGAYTATPIITPSLTTHASNETLVCFGFGELSGFTNGAGWTTASPFDDTYLAAEYQNANAAGAYTGTFGSSAGSALGLLVAVKSTTSVSGHAISGSLGASAAGATVTYWGQSYGTITADGSGNYSIGALADGVYTIKPSLAGRLFTPFTQNATVSGADVTGVNFTSAASTSGFIDTNAWFIPDNGLAQPFASGAYGEVPGIVERASAMSENAVGNSLCDFHVTYGSYTLQGGPGLGGPGTVVLQGGTFWWNVQQLQYGTIEVRAKFGGLNLHCTSWMYDSSIRDLYYVSESGANASGLFPNTYGDEIDFGETRPQISSNLTFIHVGNFSGNTGVSGGATITDYSANFHVYKAVFAASSILYYIDGVLVYTATGAFTTNPLMFIADIEAADASAGTAVAGNFPQDYQLDYVKAWDASGNLVFYDEFDGSPAYQLINKSNLRFVQAMSAVGTVSTTQVLTPAYKVTGNSWMLAMGVVAGTTATTMSITDQVGNVWSQVGTNWNDGTNTYAVFQASMKTLITSTNAITLHSTRSAQLNLVFAEYHLQQANGSVVDVVATGNWASTAASIGPITSTGTNESIVAIAWLAASSAASAADGTIRLNADGTTNGFVEDRSLAAAGAATASWTNGAGGGAGMVLAIRSTSTNYGIAGNIGVAGATVSYSGTASGSVVADSGGNYTLPNLPNGSYTVTPSLANYVFSPANAAQVISGANASGVNFTAAPITVYSVPDCRLTPNTGVTVQGTILYTGQTSSNPAIPPTDSRAAGAPVDSRVAPNIPQNSRTQPPF